MRASFFPSSDEEPQPPEYVVKAWWQPPADEFPPRVLVREFLARTEN